MSTNPMESMIEIVCDHARNVKRWRDGDMRLRWAAAGMECAAEQFRRIRATGSYRSSPTRSDTPSARTPTSHQWLSQPERMIPQEVTTNFHDEQVILSPITSHPPCASALTQEQTQERR
jgi:hypothetical protein